MLRNPGRPSDFLRIGHRGAAATAPENTAASFARALGHAVDMIECDLQLTADGEVVIIHDWTADRTTSGEGEITALASDALRALDAGAWMGSEFSGQCVPTLAETLDQVLPHARLNLELKSRGSREASARLAIAAAEAVRARDAMDRVVFSSFNPETLLELRTAVPEAPIGVLWGQEDYTLAFEIADKLGAVSLHPWALQVTPELVSKAHGAGLAVLTWTENEVGRIVELARMGCDGIISDWPERLLEARDVLG